MLYDIWWFVRFDLLLFVFLEECVGKIYIVIGFNIGIGFEIVRYFVV